MTTDDDQVADELSAAVEEVGDDLVGRSGSWFDRLVDTALVLSGIVIGLVALAVTFNVLSRQFFGRSYTWAFEYSEYGVLFLVFLGLAGVARSDGHVRMEIADEFLPPRALKRLSVGTEILNLLIAGALTATGAWITYRNYADGTTIGLLNSPKWVVLAVIPLGSAMLFAVQLVTVWRRVRTLSDPAPTED